MHDIVPTHEGLAEMKPLIFVFGKTFVYLLFLRDKNLFLIRKKVLPKLAEFIDK